MTKKRNTAAIAVTLVLATLLLGGCAGKKKRAPRKSGSEQYQQAQALIEKKNYAKAREVLGSIGSRELQDTSLDPLVKLALADAYYKDGGITNIIEGQARYEQFINFYPTNESTPYAQFQVGLCLYDQSAKPYNDQEYTRRALEEFAKVRAIDPDSPYVARAAGMMDKCRDKLARHEFDVGRFYRKRGACESAAGRFRDVLNDYPKFSATEATTFYLADALICTHNTDEARIYLEKMLNDFPDSRYSSDAKEALSRIAPPKEP